MRDITARKQAEEELRGKEAELRAITEITPVMLTRCSRDLRYLFINHAYAAMLGSTPDRIIGKPILEIMGAQGFAAIRARVDQVLRGEPVEYEDRVHFALTGRAHWLHVIYIPDRDERGEVVGWVASMTDITARKEAETAVHLSEERFRILSDTAARLLATDNPQGVVEELASRVMAHLDCQVFFNFLVDGSGGRLRLNAFAGIPAEVAPEIEWLDFGVAVCGCVAREGKRIIANDIFSTPDTRTALVKSFGVQAYCCHPLVAQGKLMGTLSFGTTTRSRFNENEIEVMRTIADQVAIAMQRVRAMEGLERAVAERTASLEEANRELARHTKQLRELAGELTMTEQRERKHLAKILHDGLQQYLVAAKLNVAGLIRSHDPEANRSAAEIEKMLAEAIKVSRTLAAELSPPILHDAGLLASLEWLARWMLDKHGLRVELQVEQMDAPALEEDVKVLLFESVRELLLNVVKHAKTRHARIYLSRLGESLQIQVSDDGAGFKSFQGRFEKEQMGGFGLFSIRERITLIGGSLQCDSSPGKGTRLTLTAPPQRLLRAG